MKYQSLSNPDPYWRWIAPHAIAFDGFCWHTRAFCLSDESFKNFLLSRITKIRGSRDRKVTADNDGEWHSEITLVVGPHPELSESQTKFIALDYGMRGGKAKIKVRRTLLYYALKRLGWIPIRWRRRCKIRKSFFLTERNLLRSKKNRVLEKHKCSD